MATEQAFPSGTAIAIGGGRVITSPFQFIADQDTFLRVVSACSIVGVTIAIQGRRLDEHGQLQPIQEIHVPNSDRSVKTQDFGLGLGAVLNFTAFASAGAPRIGQCYLMVQLLRNFGGGALVLGTLLGGYVTATQALGFPGSPIVPSTSGEPVLRAIVGTTPLVGSDINETVPTGARWELVAFTAVLTTSATVANRSVELWGASGGNVAWLSVAPGAQTASLVGAHSWAPAYAPLVDAANARFQNATPTRALLVAAMNIQTHSIGFQVGDQWSAPQYVVREWLEVG